MQSILSARKSLCLAMAGVAIGFISGCGEMKTSEGNSDPLGAQAKSIVHPEIWPEVDAGLKVDPAVEGRIDDLLSAMTVADKVGQIVQADLGSITPEEMKQYRLGSILEGGNSAPGEHEYATVEQWVASRDLFWEAAMAPREDGGVLIPPVFGIDAVHGHNNVIGGTVFPHNIGLGAANNPDLIRKIAEVTAKELTVTGHDWTFAPTLAVVRDDRWGRTYEGYSESPEIVAAYAPQVVEGLQGEAGSEHYLAAGKVISTAKHFVGDGGTDHGKDTGNNSMSEEDLRDLQAAGYPAAIEAGVSSVMASFSSWQGVRMHGHKGLLTDILKGRWNYEGFVVGDWNGHGLIDGCTNTRCPDTINSGLDMFMAPDSWKALYHSTLDEVNQGVIPMARLNDAVRRILRVKIVAGLLDKPKPSERAMVGDSSILGAPAHKEIARQAVRESLVLLKNNNLLPLSPKAKVLVAGSAADSISQASGGWTLTWQGGGLDNKLFPNGESIYHGIQSATEAAGGSATLSVDGTFSQKPDVAIVVFGEDPYAEFVGDREHVGYDPAGTKEIQMLRRLKEAGIPVVSVFISGRPMWVNPEINASDAFVAAWLPGTEGGGVADVLFSHADGRVNHDFKGRLSFSWPRSASQTAVNVGDENYKPLFAYGSGFSYASSHELPTLDEDSGLENLEQLDSKLFYQKGKVQAPWQMYFGNGDGQWQAIESKVSFERGALSMKRNDHQAQEDAWQLSWNGEGLAQVFLGNQEIGYGYQRETMAAMELVIDYKLSKAPTQSVAIGWGCDVKHDDCMARLSLDSVLSAAEINEWQTLRLSLACFDKKGVNMTNTRIPFFLETEGELELSFSHVRLEADNNETRACLP